MSNQFKEYATKLVKQQYPEFDQMSYAKREVLQRRMENRIIFEWAFANRPFIERLIMNPHIVTELK